MRASTTPTVGGVRAAGSGMRAARPNRVTPPNLTIPTVKRAEVLYNAVKFTTKVAPSEMGTPAQNAAVFCAFSASVASLVAGWETPDGPKAHLTLPNFFPERREISWRQPPRPRRQRQHSLRGSRSRGAPHRRAWP